MTTQQSPDFLSTWLAQADARNAAARRARWVRIVHELEQDARDYPHQRTGKWLSAAAKRITQALAYDERETR